MRYVVAVVVSLMCGTASAQGIFFEDSYSTPDYGYGRSTSSYGFGGGYYGSSYDYSPRYGLGYGYSSGRSSFMLPPRSRRQRW